MIGNGNTGAPPAFTALRGKRWLSISERSDLSPGPFERSQGGRWSWEYWLAAAGALLLFLPDTDGFVLELAGNHSLLLWLSDGKALPVCQRYTPYVAMLLCPCALVALRLVRFTWPVVVVLSCCGLAGFWACGLGLAGDTPAFMVLRGKSILDLLLLTLAIIIITAARTRPDLLRALFLGVACSAVLKVVFSAVMYAKTGGVPLLPQISSLQADGGNLNTQVFVAAVSLAVAVERWLTGKRSQAFWSVAFFLAFAAAIGMSFRRLVTIRLIVVSLGSVLALFWLRGRLKQGLMYASAFGLLLAVCLAGATVALFGPDLVKDRLMSLSSPTASETAGSNEAYLDDWRAWPKSIAYSRFLGTGLDAYPGIHRPFDEYGGPILPLHTGAFELWSSLGWAGMLFHLVVLLVVPLAVLQCYRRRPAGIKPATVVGIVYTLFVGVFPFGAPFLGTGQTSLVLGATIGLVVGSHPALRSVAAPRRLRRQADLRSARLAARSSPGNSPYRQGKRRPQLPHTFRRQDSAAN